GLRRCAVLCSPRSCSPSSFFTATAATETYTLSLHDALPILGPGACRPGAVLLPDGRGRNDTLVPVHDHPAPGCRPELVRAAEDGDETSGISGKTACEVIAGGRLRGPGRWHRRRPCLTY